MSKPRFKPWPRVLPEEISYKFIEYARASGELRRCYAYEVIWDYYRDNYLWRDKNRFIAYRVLSNE